MDQELPLREASQSDHKKVSRLATSTTVESVLGPIQFIIYINDSQPTASLFAADAKKYKIRTEADYEAMQRGMKKLDD